MALHTSTAGGIPAKREYFDMTALAAAEARFTSVCRCAGCGSPIAFNSLMLTCQCLDEIDRSLAPAVRVTPVNRGVK